MLAPLDHRDLIKTTMGYKGTITIAIFFICSQREEKSYNCGVYGHQSSLSQTGHIAMRIADKVADSRETGSKEFRCR
jgi:hypothetical protein